MTRIWVQAHKKLSCAQWAKIYLSVSKIFKCGVIFQSLVIIITNYQLERRKECFWGLLKHQAQQTRCAEVLRYFLTRCAIFYPKKSWVHSCHSAVWGRSPSKWKFCLSKHKSITKTFNLSKIKVLPYLKIYIVYHMNVVH